MTMHYLTDKKIYCTAMERFLKNFYLTFFILASGLSVSAQQNIGYENPYRAVYEHLANLQDDQYFPEISALSFHPTLDSTHRVELAIKLKRIFDGKGLYVMVNRIPKDSLFRDSIARDHVYFPFPSELPDVYLEREEGLWTYSLKTARSIPILYRATYPFGLDKLIEFTSYQGGKKYLGLYGWQYIGIIILILLSFLFHFLLSKLLDFVISRSFWKSSILNIEKTDLLRKADGKLSLVLVFTLLIYFIPVLQLPVKLSTFLQKGLKIVVVIFVMMLAFGIIDIIKVYLRDMALKTESKLDDQLVPMITKTIKVGIIIITTFHILHLLQVNITAIIAGISIGGLALALAAQDTVKNLIGSIMIFFDKPFQIGDYIMSGEIEGSVVEVGFRSTRIMKPDTSIISVPNGTISNNTLNNLGVRELRMFRTTINLMYITPVDKLRKYIESLRQLALDHPRINNERVMIYLNNLGPSSIDIFFRVYIETRDFEEELSLKEEVIYRIIELAQEIDVGFAFPSSSIYLEKFPEKENNSETVDLVNKDRV